MSQHCRFYGWCHVDIIFSSCGFFFLICHIQNSLYVQLLRSPILAALLHGTPAVRVSQTWGVVQGMELQNFRRRRHLYSAGLPSRWASAHILVCQTFFSVPLQYHLYLHKSTKHMLLLSAAKISKCKCKTITEVTKMIFYCGKL